MTSIGLEHVNWDEVDENYCGIPDTPEIVPLQPAPYAPDWPIAAKHLLERERPEAPVLDLNSILPAELADWVEAAAGQKGAPADYVLMALLTAAGSAIGTSRWAMPRLGWSEPPILWTALIGNPSAGKSPALDAIQDPLRDIENAQRKAAEGALKEWEAKAEVAALAASAWKSAGKKAFTEGGSAPERPAEMELEPRPHVPRLITQDITVERLADILSYQPRGTLQIRDELTGWLEGMSRYSSGSDRPFWLEAYGGRSFTVERMSRPPVTVASLAVGVVGGIQPDRLNSLLFNSDDDGLLARFIPVWPDPMLIGKPQVCADTSLIERVFTALYALNMPMDEGRRNRLFVHFDDAAETALDQFRIEIRELERASEGLMMSFLGKLPGLSVRLVLVLTCLRRALTGNAEPSGITLADYEAARDFILDYIIPMARRAYAGADVSHDERTAAKLVTLFREKGWNSFTTRELIRLGRKGLKKADQINPALALLEDGGIIRPVEPEKLPGGGRPVKRFNINPEVNSTR